MKSRIQEDTYVHSYEKKLIDVNKKYWDGIPNIVEGKEWIYVFHGIPYELEYTVNEDIVAKGLQAQVRLPVVSVAYKVRRKTNDQLDASFGIEQTIFLDSNQYKDGIADIRAQIAAKFLSVVTYKKKEKLFQIKYRGIECGNAIHDEIIRANAGKYYDCFDINREEYRQFLYEAFLIIEKAEKIFKKHKPAYIITTECDYLKGLFVSVALSMGAKLYITSSDSTSADVIMAVSGKKVLYKEIMIGDILQRGIETYLEKNPVNDREEDNFFVLKVKGSPNNDVLGQIGIKNQKKNVFIMLHAMSDVPREACKHYIYADYNEWFLDTLRIIKHVKNVNWIIKDHPMAEFFRQENYIRSLFVQHKADHIYWCDRNISGMQIKEVADCVVTCAGDVGIEYWAYGIPTITVAKAYYCEWGISYNMKSLEEYEAILEKIVFIKKPDMQSVKKAQKYLAAYREVLRSKDDFAGLFYDIRNMQVGRLKDGNKKYDYVFFLFCQKYIELLKKKDLRSSTVFQLKNVFEV